MLNFKNSLSQEDIEWLIVSYSNSEPEERNNLHKGSELFKINPIVALTELPQTTNIIEK